MLISVLILVIKNVKERLYNNAQSMSYKDGDFGVVTVRMNIDARDPGLKFMGILGSS